MSFFRTYIDEPIQKELFNRIDSINFQKSPQGLLDSVQSKVQHQFVKSCWARASVVLGEDDGNKVVSLNSNLDENNKPINEPLNIKNGNPYRGRPGITSISSTFKEYFMKQGTINFYVPDPKDFDVFKKQFLKFGRYMLVEFGWSLPYNLSLPTLSGETILEISQDIQDRILLGNGNYNALVGVVTNYTFNQNKEGAYEGTIEISSMGRNIIGQKSKTDGKVENLVGYVNNKLIDVDKDTTDDVELTPEEKQILKKLKSTFIDFNATIAALQDVVEDYVKDSSVKSEDYSIKLSNRTKEFKSYYRNGAYVIDDSEIFTKDEGFFKETFGLAKDKLCYVTWGWFEDFILNSFFSFTSKEKGQEFFKTEFRSVKSTKKEVKRRQTDYIQTQNTIYGSVYTPDAETGLPIETPTALSTIQVDVIGSEVVENKTDYINTLCRSHPDLYSLGYQSVILPGKTKKFDTINVNATQLAIDKAVIRSTIAFAGQELLTNTLKREKDNSEIFKEITNKFDKLFPKFEKEKDKTGQIRNMVFEVDYLIESFKSSQNIEQSINNFWQKVSNDYGGFWRFAVIEDENFDGRIMVTDMNIGSVDDKEVKEQLSTRENPNRVFKFPIYSKDSIVSEFQLQSENSSEMATMAVYGSNVDLSATSADDGKGHTALAMRALSSLDNTDNVGSGSNNTEQDKQYFDNVLKYIQNPIFGNFSDTNKLQGSSAKYSKTGKLLEVQRNGGILFDDTPEITQTSNKIYKDLLQTELYDTSDNKIRQSYFWFEDNDTKVQIYSGVTGAMYDEFKRTMLFNINKAPGSDSNYSVVLPVVPLQLSLTLQGIGGIKIGDLFYVEYLPEQYRKYCHFMVVNVEHEISTTGWTTKLDSRMIVDIPKMINEKQIEQLTKLEFIQVKKSLNTTVNEIKEKYEGINKKLEEKYRQQKFQRDTAAFAKSDIGKRLKEQEVPDALDTVYEIPEGL